MIGRCRVGARSDSSWTDVRQQQHLRSCFRYSSNQVSEASFRITELANAAPEKKAGYRQTGNDSRPVQIALTAKYTPSKSIDDTDHRIERVEKAPLFRH